MLVSRHQVSLVITNEKTSSVVDTLKRDKRLKTLIVKFLDFYAENPQQAELMLEGNNDIQTAIVEESEKLTKLKSSLELFKAFLDTAKRQNESNVESYTDYLTNEEYFKFKTEFEKSEQNYNQLYLNETAATHEQIVETKNLENEVNSLRNELLELKSIVSSALTSKSPISSNQNSFVTHDLNDDLLDSSSTQENFDKNADELLVYEVEDEVINEVEVETDESKHEVYEKDSEISKEVSNEIKEDDTLSVHSQDDTNDEEEENEFPYDVSDALSILDALDI